MAEPDSAMGSIIDPTFKVLIGGFTQATFSQTLAFAPGAQIMIQNAQGANVLHTFQVISTTSFPPNPSFSLSPAGGSTIGAGFATGTVSSGQSVGPFTLTAGTWFIGCAFHYTSENMRTVLQVATGATPGPQATAPPQATPPPVGGLY